MREAFLGKYPMTSVLLHHYSILIYAILWLSLTYVLH